MNDSSTPALEIEGASKSYGKIQALNRVSLRVDNGEFVALLGPNGAGKSTMFQILSGLFTADEGSMLIAGHDLEREAVKCLGRLGVVFQQPTLDLDLSVRANLVFHARLHGIGGARRRQRIDEELARLEITDLADRPCRTLSGGNRRKVELARALLPEPRLLLMDEATVGLDPGSRQTLLDQVHGLCASRGMGVLWATHLVDEADRADRVLVLDKGEMLATGTPATLLEQTGKATLAEAFLSLTGHPGGGEKAA